MLDVRVKFRDLRIGDVYTTEYEGEQTLLSLPVADMDDPLSITFETNEHRGDNRWHATTVFLDHEVTLHATNAHDVASRIADALDRFPADVRAAVARLFCPRCGVRECKMHL